MQVQCINIKGLVRPAIKIGELYEIERAFRTFNRPPLYKLKGVIGLYSTDRFISELEGF